MQGRAFLSLARDLIQKATEPYWRAAVIHAYYALFLECRDILARWGFAALPRYNIHATARLRYLSAADPDLQQIAKTLDTLVRGRNHASYNLDQLTVFTTAKEPHDMVRQAEAALALLDAIDTDPGRRATTIASFPP